MNHNIFNLICFIKMSYIRIKIKQLCTMSMEWEWINQHKGIILHSVEFYCIFFNKRKLCMLKTFFFFSRFSIFYQIILQHYKFNSIENSSCIMNSFYFLSNLITFKSFYGIIYFLTCIKVHWRHGLVTNHIKFFFQSSLFATAVWSIIFPIITRMCVFHSTDKWFMKQF